MPDSTHATNRDLPAGAAARVGGRPTVVDDYARGKLVIALACGLTQREAAGGSWRASAHLLGEFEKRDDPLTIDQLVEGMSLMLEQVNAARRREG